MKFLPNTTDPLVIRTDFEHQQAWETISRQISAPVRDAGETFYAYVEFLEDTEFRDLGKEELLARVPPDYVHSFLLVVDTTAALTEDFPILVIDLNREPGRAFRTIPAQVPGIANNLSIANMDFADFADSVGEDGVFRGFLGP